MTAHDSTGAVRRIRMRPTRSGGLGLAAGVLATIALAACGSSSSGSAKAGATSGGGHPSTNGGKLTALTIGTPTVSPPGVPVAVLSEFGYGAQTGVVQKALAKYGYSLKSTVGFTTSSAQFAALESGAVNVAEGGDTPALVARGTGNQTRAVMVSSPETNLWLVANPAQATSVAALAGKSVGFPFGSNLDQYGRQVLLHAGIYGRTKLVNLPTTSEFGGLESGGVAAAVAPPGLALAWRAQDPKLVIVNKASADSWAELAVPVIWSVEQSFLAAHPTLTKALWAAEQASEQAVEHDRAGFYEWYDREAGITTPIAKASMLLDFSSTPISSTGLESVENADQFMERFHFIKSPVKLSSWIVGAPAK